MGQSESLDTKRAIVRGPLLQLCTPGMDTIVYPKSYLPKRPEKLALPYEWALLLQSKWESLNITFYDPFPPHELSTGNICVSQCSKKGGIHTLEFNSNIITGQQIFDFDDLFGFSLSF